MKIIKKILRKFNNRGMTLIEMVVSFVLIGLFMVAASKVISNTVIVYYEAKGITCGMQVSGILTAKIRGETEGAKQEYLTHTSIDESGKLVENTMPYMICVSSNKLEFVDKKGSQVSISVNAEQYLVVHYEALETEENGTLVTIPETDWTFDKKAYMGYTVKELSFSQPKGEYGNNIICMNLVLTSEKYGNYSVTEYFECYNFDSMTDMIVEQ